MKIARSTIDEFFSDNLRRGIQLDAPMLWGYFFIDPDRKVLESIVPLLTRLDYRYVDIFGSDDDRDLHLHVEREEMHTPHTLHARCIELDELARSNHVGDFDGFDVGNVDGSDLRGG